MNPDMQVDAQPHDETSPPHSSASPAPMARENQRSRIHIEIEYHPHSGKEVDIIPLDLTHTEESTSTRLQHQLVPAGRPPWAPFPSRADFEWAETMYMAPNKMVAAQLKGMHSNWCGNSYLTIKTVDDLRMYLERAKHYVVERLRDEPYNSDQWWEMQSALPSVAGLPHCLLPMLLWLDKGRVSSHTNMHPMILRPLFLRSQIRNASGNGGGELAGFMVQVRDRKDPDDRSHSEKICFAKFKRDEVNVYPVATPFRGSYSHGSQFSHWMVKKLAHARPLGELWPIFRAHTASRAMTNCTIYFRRIWNFPCAQQCVVQLLPKNSPFVHAIRAHLLTRMMMGLHCISEEQIKRKDTYQEEYGKYCEMTDLDAIREAMALIRMTVNQYDTQILQRIAELAERTNVSPNDIQEVPDAPNDDH
ncbi:hypothetical protein B0H13DRAFT_2345539 [Mycena leptocephala]|nr:hypothetical protein B0H13DRAFT_2345539 [Mycena leptocephala]